MYGILAFLVTLVLFNQTILFSFVIGLSVFIFLD